MTAGLDPDADENNNECESPRDREKSAEKTARPRPVAKPSQPAKPVKLVPYTGLATACFEQTTPASPARAAYKWHEAS